MSHNPLAAEILADGVFGHAGLAAVRGLAEEEPCWAVLGVALEFVGDVGRRRVGHVMAVDLDRACIHRPS